MTIKDVTLIECKFDVSMSTNTFGYTRESSIIRCNGLSLDYKIIIEEKVQFKSSKTGTYEKQPKILCYLENDTSKLFDSKHDLLMHYCSNEFE
jgi:hypothetical protein